MKYYVDNEIGLDSNDGKSPQHPMRMIGSAMREAARPGDEVIVAGPGPYEETVTTTQDGDPAAYIVVTGDPDRPRPIIRGLVIRNKHNKFSNMEVVASRLPGARQNLVFIRRGAHFTVLSRMRIDNNSDPSSDAIRWEEPSEKPFGDDAASECFISDCEITGTLAGTCLHIHGSQNMISRNRIHDVGQSDFVRLWGEANTIQDNVFENNIRVEGVGNHIDFIQTFGRNGYGSRGHLIRRNIVRNVEGQLTQLEGNLLAEVGKWEFRDNVFEDIMLQASCTIPRVQYIHNVFVRCNYSGGHALTFGTREYGEHNSGNGQSGTNRADGARVMFNVFLDCGGEGNDNRGWYAIRDVLGDVEADYNFVTKDGFQAVRVDRNHLAVGSADGWSDFRWWENNGINGGDPMLGPGYLPLPGSPLIHPNGLVTNIGIVDFTRFEPDPNLTPVPDPDPIVDPDPDEDVFVPKTRWCIVKFVLGRPEIVSEVYESYDEVESALKRVKGETPVAEFYLCLIDNPPLKP